MITGSPVCSVTIPLACHPLTTVSSARGKERRSARRRPNGSCAVTLTTSRLETSCAETARSNPRWYTSCCVVTAPELRPLSSINFPPVYATRNPRPLAKRRSARSVKEW